MNNERLDKLLSQCGYTVTKLRVDGTRECSRDTLTAVLFADNQDGRDQTLITALGIDKILKIPETIDENLVSKWIRREAPDGAVTFSVHFDHTVRAKSVFDVDTNASPQLICAKLDHRWNEIERLQSWLATEKLNPSAPLSPVFRFEDRIVKSIDEYDLSLLIARWKWDAKHAIIELFTTKELLGQAALSDTCVWFLSPSVPGRPANPASRLDLTVWVPLPKGTNASSEVGRLTRTEKWANFEATGYGLQISSPLDLTHGIAIKYIKSRIEIFAKHATQVKNEINGARTQPSP